MNRTGGTETETPRPRGIWEDLLRCADHGERESAKVVEVFSDDAFADDEIERPTVGDRNAKAYRHPFDSRIVRTASRSAAGVVSMSRGVMESGEQFGTLVLAI